MPNWLMQKKHFFCTSQRFLCQKMHFDEPEESDLLLTIEEQF